MTDPALTACENCGGGVKKILYPVGLAFKGSGFYVNDYAKAAPAANAAKGEAAETPKTEPAAETKTEPSVVPPTTPAPVAADTTAKS